MGKQHTYLQALLSWQVPTEDKGAEAGEWVKEWKLRRKSPLWIFSPLFYLRIQSRSTHTLTFSTPTVGRAVCFPVACLFEANLLLTQFMCYTNPHQITAPWDHIFFTLSTIVEPYFKDSIKVSKKKRQIFTQELLPSLICTVYLIVCEARGSSEHVDFCVWSLT